MAYTNIDDPSAHFTTTLHTGDGTSPKSITNSANSGDFQPDLIWAKGRSTAYEHQLSDSSRGTSSSNGLASNTSNAEGFFSSTYGYVSSFDSNGFTATAGSAGGPPYYHNASGTTYVFWQWKANGGTTSSNTSGTITSTVQANTEAGFSIVTYTGNGTDGATIGHGLGVAPEIIITKTRDTAQNWYVWSSLLSGDTYGLGLNLTAAEAVFTFGNYENVNSSTMGTNNGGSAITNVNGNSNDYVAYCFASKQGYSKFGKYKGLLGTTRPVYTGFKPAFIMIKNANASASWHMFDAKREGYNPDNDPLYANLNNVEGTADEIDIYSNGFRVITNDAEVNGVNNTIIYMAFAENPFVTSTGIPTTAR